MLQITKLLKLFRLLKLLKIVKSLVMRKLWRSLENLNKKEKVVGGWMDG
jgi:hypothetical protein